MNANKFFKQYAKGKGAITMNVVEFAEAYHKQASLQPISEVQPSEIERLLKGKYLHLQIIDEFGWTGEWRMSAKGMLDLLIDLKALSRGVAKESVPSDEAQYKEYLKRHPEHQLYGPSSLED